VPVKPPAASPGHVIFLNGVSSSGKSSIAQRLLRILRRPYFHLAVDMFGAMLDVTFVGVHCDPVELARRERARGDRVPGQAAAQLTQVHAHGTYDLECDTTTDSPDHCASQIAQFLAQRTHGPTAFDRLRSALLT
jgi:chloramphenicol 3-O-phosphotransferase